MATIDLSQLDPPNLIEEVDLASTQANYALLLPFFEPSIGPIVEGDPLWDVCGIMAKREIAIREGINAAARGVFLSSMDGTNLDNAGALVDAERLVTDPDTIPPTYEGDEPFRRAVHTTPLTFGTGSQVRYERAALAADTRIETVYAATPNPTELRIEWIPREGVDPGDSPDIEDEILRSIALTDDDGFQIQMLTDTITIQEGGRPTVNVSADVYIGLGEDEDEITAAILESFAASEHLIRPIRSPVPRSLIIALLDVDGVHKVDLSLPLADIASTPLLGHQWGSVIPVYQVATWL